MYLKANNISYSHIPNGKNIFENLNFHIKSGEKIAITAPSGFGKTTLCKILSGYESPSSGVVLLDDTPLHKFKGSIASSYVCPHSLQ